LHHDERPRFHLTPPANWMNDPNGLSFRDGRLHVNYQYNPDAPHWDRMHWGHAVSDDLVTWRHLPIALSPEEGSPDAFGCWSGCIVDDDGIAVMLYTGVGLDGELRRQTICRATSVDGLSTWSKDPANPLIVEPPDGIDPDLFRDPFVWRDGDDWAMLIGAGTIYGVATVLLYRSPDLRAWSYVGPILSSDDVAPAAGADGPCWECPQLVRFGDADVLIVSVMDRAPGVRPSHVSAFVGHLSGDRFEVDHGQQLGMGPDFYAPATTVAPDGRRILIGWIPEDPPPPSSNRDWAGALTFPRVVSVDAAGHVDLRLAEEIASLRGTHSRTGPHVLRAGAAAWRWELPEQDFEVLLDVDPGAASEIVIELVDGDTSSPEVRIIFRPVEHWLSVERRGIVSVAGRSSQGAAILPDGDGVRALSLRAIVDGSVMELEANGRTTATVRLPTSQGTRQQITLAASGGRARLASLDAWRLERSRQTEPARYEGRDTTGVAPTAGSPTAGGSTSAEDAVT